MGDSKKDLKLKTNIIYLKVVLVISIPLINHTYFVLFLKISEMKQKDTHSSFR